MEDKENQNNQPVEESKEDEKNQPVNEDAKDIDNGKTDLTVDTDSIANGIVSRLKKVFTKDEPKQEKQEPSNDEIQKAIDEAVKAEMEKNYSKMKSARAKELEEEKNALDLQNELNKHAEKTYHDFIKFKVEKEGKTVEEVVKENPYVKIKQSPKWGSSGSDTSTSQGLDKSRAERLNFIKKNS